MKNNREKEIYRYVKEKKNMCISNDRVSKDLFQEYGVNLGLRDDKGRGVLTGLTNISEIKAFENVNGEKVPCDGRLLYRGYDVNDLVAGAKGKKFVFEEAAYLLLFGELPTMKELDKFRKMIAESEELPTNFTRDVIMKAPSKDIMNSMTRSVLTLASYDNNADN